MEASIAIGYILEGTVLLWVYDPSQIDIKYHIKSNINLLLQGLRTNTGKDSLVVTAAQAGVSLAEAAVIQAQAQIILARSNQETAQKAIQQAQLALDLAN